MTSLYVIFWVVGPIPRYQHFIPIILLPCPVCSSTPPIAMATATPVVHPLYFQLHNRPQTQNHHISLSKPSLRGPTLPRASLSPPPSAEGTPSEASQLSGCMKCGKQDLEKGCNGDGRIQGGIATIPGFGWWPIKAYKPCPGLVELGGTYKRYGQSLDEIVGRSDRSK